MACIKTKKHVVELFNNLVNIFPQTGGGGTRKMSAGISFSWYLLQIWNINSWDMWLSTHYFSGFLQDWFHVFLYEIKNNSVWYNFIMALQCPITFYIFEHYQLWMMDSKGQRVFFPKTPQLCVWHTEVRRCYHFKLVSHFQLWFPIWGVLVNRLKAPSNLRPQGTRTSLQVYTPALTMLDAHSKSQYHNVYIRIKCLHISVIVS